MQNYLFTEKNGIAKYSLCVLVIEIQIIVDIFQTNKNLFEFRLITDFDQTQCLIFKVDFLIIPYLSF